MVDIRFVPVGNARADKQLWISHGKTFVTVVAKAAFGPDGQSLSDCDAVQERDVHIEDDSTRSLSDATDLVPYLGTGEVWFRGNAYVPAGGTAQARLAVLRKDRPLVDKRVVVRAPATGAGITSIPMTYEHAFGGPGTADNPVGRPQPNLVHPSDSSRPAALGPIAPIWRSRTALLGRAFKRPRAGATIELQQGFPWAYFHAVPEDQRSPEFFKLDETIRIERLSSVSSVVEMHLPSARAEARVLRGSSKPLSIGFNADVIRVDGERLRTTVTWRGFFELPAHSSQLVIAVGIGLPDQPIVWPQAARGSTVQLKAPRTGQAHLDDAVMDGTGTLDGVVEGSEALPFDRGGRPSSQPPAPGSDTLDGSGPGPRSTPFQRGLGERSRPSATPAAPIVGAPWGPPAAQPQTPFGAQTLDSDPRRPSKTRDPEPAPGSPSPPQHGRSLPAGMVAPPAPVIQSAPAPVAPAPVAPVPVAPAPVAPAPVAPVLGRPLAVAAAPVAEVVELAEGLGSDLLLALVDKD